MTTTQNPSKGIIIFLIKFIGIYLVGNVGYGLFIEYYAPAPDPATWWVSENVALILNWLNEGVSLSWNSESPYIGFIRESKTIILVFEGCNGINVMIVYLSFLIAFKGRTRKTLVFVGFGLTIIYLMNLLRVSVLYEVALHFPSQLYFFHKYFFTALLYVVVFILWFLWVRQVKNSE